MKTYGPWGGGVSCSSVAVFFWVLNNSCGGCFQGKKLICEKNRIDALEVFRSLTRENMNIIVDLMLSEVSANLVEKGIDMDVTQSAKDWLADSGYDIHFGARPLRRVIQNNIEDNLSDSLLKGELQPGDTAVIDVEDGKILITPKSSLPIASA